MSRQNWLRAMKHTLVAATLFAVTGPARADVSITIIDANTATARHQICQPQQLRNIRPR